MDGVEGMAQPLGHQVDFHAHLSIFVQNSVPGYRLSLPSSSPCETVCMGEPVPKPLMCSHAVLG